MKTFVAKFLVLALLSPALAAFDQEEDAPGEIHNNSSRQGRWSFGTAIRIPDEPCTAGNVNGMAMAGALTGVCRSQKVCTRQRGTVIPGSTCADGAGVCCAFSMACPLNNNGNNNVVTVRNSGSHVTNAAASAANAQPCEIRIPRPSRDVIQVRVDFVAFTFPQPDDNGMCMGGSLTFNSPNQNIGPLCGNGAGQRFYLHYGDADTISISINSNGNSVNNGNNGNNAPIFDLLITFIEVPARASGSSKNNKRKGRRFGSGGSKNNNVQDEEEANDISNEPAPNGCDQYYTTTSGEVRSFNYAPPSTNTANTPTQLQLDNQHYTVCIRTPSTANQITWSRCSTNDVFSITGVDGSGPGESGDACSTDFVDIPGGMPSSRYCGESFPEVVTSSAKPFLLYVSFDEQESNPFANVPVNPLTGCPIGTMCVNQFGAEIPTDGTFPDDGSTLPCGSAAAIANLQYCLPENGLGGLIDSTNSGFCLQFTVA